MRDDVLSLLAESVSGVGAWRLQADGRRLQWTPQTWALHGLQPREGPWTLQQALEHVAPPDRRRLTDALHAALEGSTAFELDYTLVLPDGSPRRVRSRAACRPDGKGSSELVGILEHGVGLLAMPAGASLEQAVAAAGVGVWEMDLVTGEEVWSNHTLALYGLPPGSPAPSRPQWRAQFLHPADAPRVDARAARFMATSEPYELDYRIRRADDGEVRWMHSRAAFAFGGSRRVLGVTIDITDLREKDREVTELLNRLQMATEASGLGAWERDARTGVSRWGRTTLALFGLPPDAPVPDREALLGRVVEEDRERVRLALQQADEQFLPLDLEYRVALPGGGTRWLRSRGSMERDAQGQPLRSIGVSFDTTALREAEAAQQARLLAEQANAAKTQFLSRMSHELRTPLNAVLGFAQLLSMDPADALSAGQRARLDHIQAAGWHLLALVNLLSNAIKYNRPQGSVVVQAKLLPSGFIEFCVRDTGEGLTPEQLARLFEPFDRLGRETSGIEGTGLGLALSKLLVEQMGGQITVRSTPGVGSEFSFSVPATPG